MVCCLCDVSIWCVICMVFVCVCGVSDESFVWCVCGVMYVRVVW